jgi:hypothetical protein
MNDVFAILGRFFDLLKVIFFLISISPSETEFYVHISTAAVTCYVVFLLIKRERSEGVEGRGQQRKAVEMWGQF